MPILDTGFLSPSSNGTPATYDGSATEFSNPSNAYASDNNYATAVDNEYQYKWQSYGNFGISLDSSFIIKGIEVGIEGKTSTGISEFNVYLEDADSNFSSVSPGYFNTTESASILGDPTTLPGGNWTAEGFSNANFHVLVATGGINDGRTIYLDHLKIKVYYDTGPNTSDTSTITENVNIRVFYSSDIEKSEEIVISEYVSGNMETLAISVMENIEIESLAYDANDGITYDTGTIFEQVQIEALADLQSIRYGVGGRGQGSTERNGE